MDVAKKGVKTGTSRGSYRRRGPAPAFDEGRAEMIRLICKRIGALDLSACAIGQATGLSVSKQDLHRLREGDPDRWWGQRRLAHLADALGLRVEVRIVEGQIPRPLRALASA